MTSVRRGFALAALVATRPSHPSPRRSSRPSRSPSASGSSTSARFAASPAAARMWIDGPVARARHLHLRAALRLHRPRRPAVGHAADGVLARPGAHGGDALRQARAASPRAARGGHRALPERAPLARAGRRIRREPHRRAARRALLHLLHPHAAARSRTRRSASRGTSTPSAARRRSACSATSRSPPPLAASAPLWSRCACAIPSTTTARARSASRSPTIAAGSPSASRATSPTPAPSCSPSPAPAATPSAPRASPGAERAPCRGFPRQGESNHRERSANRPTDRPHSKLDLRAHEARHARIELRSRTQGDRR